MSSLNVPHAAGSSAPVPMLTVDPLVLRRVQVRKVEPEQSTLFGFPASQMVGASLCDWVDIFDEWRAMNGVSELQLLMLALLDKEAEMPGEGATARRR